MIAVPPEFQTVGIVGAGAMGAGIAHAFAMSGAAVVIVDVDPVRAGAAIAQVARLFDGAVTRRKMDPAQAAAAAARVTSVPGIGDFRAGLDLIVEAVPENAALKRSVLAAAAAREPRLLATNTSALSVGDLAAGLPRPDRFLGLHFFNPVWAMALVEVVVGPQTGAAARRDALAACAQIGKQTVVVRDAPGFASSRLGVLLGLEAMRMVEEGIAEPADIDRAMELGYRHPIGPLRLTDLVGLDVRLDIARNLQAAYGARFAPPQILIDRVAAGKLGKKSGEGFYRWPPEGEEP